MGLRWRCGVRHGVSVRAVIENVIRRGEWMPLVDTDRVLVQRKQEEEDQQRGQNWQKQQRRYLVSVGKRPPPPPLCPTCGRRMWDSTLVCSFCNPTSSLATPPTPPGPEDCCQSTPQCENCVWTIYEQKLRQFETEKQRERSET